LQVSGPDIATESVYVVTRKTIDARFERGALSRITQIYVDSGATLPTVYPAEFRHLAQPGLTLRGTVKEVASGKPASGLNVVASMRSSTNGASAKTDAQGRYELAGLRLEGNLSLSVLNSGDRPYIDTTRKLLLRADQPPGEIDFEVALGVVVNGQVTDRETGKPVKGWMQYLAWAGNEELKKLPGGYDTLNTMMTDEDGKYRLIVPRGPGVLAFSAAERRYEPAQPEDFGLPVDTQRGMTHFPSVNAGLVSPSGFHAVRKIEPSSGEGELAINLEVWSGNPIKGRVVDLQNRPVREVEADGLFERSHHSRLFGGTFELRGLKPGTQRTAFFYDRNRELAAVATFKMPADGAAEPQTVRLLPAGIVSGRIVDENGRPRSGWGVGIVTAGAVERTRDRNASRDGFFEFGEATTDADGYFRIIGIPAGVSFELAAEPKADFSFARPRELLQVLHTGNVRSGQKLDLAELRVKVLDGAAIRKESKERNTNPR
jgi:protocatechuate 3,4-dioxygenase beta subunit